MVTVFRHFGGGAQRLERPRLNLQQEKNTRDIWVDAALEPDSRSQGRLERPTGRPNS